MGGGTSIILKKDKKSDYDVSASPFSLSSYEFGDTLGHGSFSTIRLALHEFYCKQLAMKEVKLGSRCAEKNADLFTTEVSALRILGRHPNLPYLHVAFVEGRSCYLGLDHINGGDLRYHINHGKGFTIKQTAFIVGSLGSALKHMHRHGMIHRDIKPENIILNAYGVPVLVDLGITYIEMAEVPPLCSSSSGTQEYLAPEVLTSGHRHSIHADYWSLGIVMYELLFDQRPFATHCCKKYIYFSDNHYFRLWDRLEKLRASGKDVIQIDWEELSSGSEEERLRILRFPNYDVPLEPDGSLPVSLRVPIPHTTALGETTFDVFAELLSGLLDVRIPLRLGVGNKYAHFMKLVSLLCRGEEAGEDSHVVPVYVPDTEQVAQYLKGKYAYNNMLQSLDVVDENEANIPFVRLDEVSVKDVEYVSPEFAQVCNVIPSKFRTTSDMTASQSESGYSP